MGHRNALHCLPVPSSRPWNQVTENGCSRPSVGGILGYTLIASLDLYVRRGAYGDLENRVTRLLPESRRLGIIGLASYYHRSVERVWPTPFAAVSSLPTDCAYPGGPRDIGPFWGLYRKSLAFPTNN
jgi:hypothetical protein